MQRTALPSIPAVVSACLAVCVLGLAGAVAQPAGPASTAVASDAIEVVSAPGESSRRSLGDLVGRLHPALVHFPIAGLVALAVVDFVGLILRRERWRQAGLVLLAATVVSALPTVATGLLRASTMGMDADEHTLLVKHRTLNLTVLGLVVAALVLRAARRRGLQGSQRVVYLALVFVATGLVLVAANYGGQMVYGIDYLPF